MLDRRQDLQEDIVELEAVFAFLCQKPCLPATARGGYHQLRQELDAADFLHPS